MGLGEERASLIHGHLRAGLRWPLPCREGLPNSQGGEVWFAAGIRAVGRDAAFCSWEREQLKAGVVHAEVMLWGFPSDSLVSAEICHYRVWLKQNKQSAVHARITVAQNPKLTSVGCLSSLGSEGFLFKIEKVHLLLFNCVSKKTAICKKGIPSYPGKQVKLVLSKDL